MGQMFTWKPIYTEMAVALLDYKKDRKPLVDWIYSNLSDITRPDGKSLIGYLHEEDGSKVLDIDPFSVFAIFNRGITDDSRKEFIRRFRGFLNLASPIPDDFAGIPLVNSQRSFFFSWKADEKRQIDVLWEMFEKALSGKSFEDEFNEITSRNGIKFMLTMGLFWIHPDKFVALDKNTRAYLKNYGIDVKEMPDYKKYTSISEDVLAKIADNVIPAESICDMSSQAWVSNDDDTEGQASNNGQTVWLWLKSTESGSTEDVFAGDRIKAGSSVSSAVRDFTAFKSKVELRAACQKVFDNTDVSIANAYWQFMTEVKKGDIVVVFKNKKMGGKINHLLYGYGHITSDLISVPGDKNPIQREVEWHTPLPDQPIVDDRSHNSLFFSKTSEQEATHIRSLLGIGGSPKMSGRKYWLAGYSYSSTESQLERFIKEGIWQGSGDDKTNSLIETIKAGDVLILKSTSTKGAKHNIPFLRAKAVGIVTSDCKKSSSWYYECNVTYTNIKEKDFVGSTYGHFRKTMHKCEETEIINWADNILSDNMSAKTVSTYQKYIDLLLENRNLILSGAPGTGKTFMAKEIAKALTCGDEEAIGFAQFHPSYDYTDFIEGLRPVKDDEGKLGFELRDGVFKTFCKKAAKNYEDSLKTQEAIEEEKGLEEKIEGFLSDAVDNATIFELKTGNKFVISSYDERTIHCESLDNEKTNRITIRLSEVKDVLESKLPLNNVHDIRDHFGRKFGTQQDSYNFVICSQIKKSKIKSTATVASVDRKNFVFIIDEINRGELSKIFGELFYSLDPDYRGKTGRVNTQYQNLVESDDIFGKGFYVPENVYVIGTMNDIDRSVESMDFAMRRRFTWEEVSPEDTQDAILAGLGDMEETAKATMARLNEVISQTDGLGSAFMIGPAYFKRLTKYGGDFSKLWKLSIRPLLKEYLRGFRKAEDILKKFAEAYFNDTQSSVSQSSSDDTDIIDED